MYSSCMLLSISIIGITPLVHIPNLFLLLLHIYLGVEHISIFTGSVSTGAGRAIYMQAAERYRGNQRYISLSPQSSPCLSDDITTPRKSFQNSLPDGTCILDRSCTKETTYVSRRRVAAGRQWARIGRRAR
jgi:hypothetical protein